MRTYAQDTALPGGKYEDGDIDAEGTAVRLPLSKGCR
jgi:coenzyme A diphosphatase NUDT7